MAKHIRGGLFEVDTIPYGHNSGSYWGTTSVKDIEDTPDPGDPFKGADPLDSFRAEGTEFTTPDDLFEHQKDDVRTMLHSKKNFLVLSEMGVGKTPEAISVAMGMKAKNVLVMLPKTLRLEWSRQIEQWTGIKPVVCHRGSYRRLNPLFEEKYIPESEGKEVSPFFILNYDTFRKDEYKEILESYPWDLIIMDEVHHLRNSGTKTTKQIFSFLEQQRKTRVIMMTGSPIVNSPLDFYTFLQMQNQSYYTNTNKLIWLEDYAYFSKQQNRIKIFGTKNEKKFREEIKPFTIRRKKEDVLKFLPEKYYRTSTLEMEDDQRELYDKMATELVMELDDGATMAVPGVLALLTRLRQVNLDPRLVPGIKGNVSSSKTEFLMDLIEEFTEGGSDGAPRKLVVFSTFADYVDLVSKQLTTKGVNNRAFSGRTASDKILPMVKEFQEDPEVQVAVGTIKVMGEGITLTGASDVVLMDRWWTPAANNQAVDRLHRPGQENAVQVILPSNDGSIDQTLDDILNMKKRMTDALLTDNGVIEEFLDAFRVTHRPAPMFKNGK